MHKIISALIFLLLVVTGFSQSEWSIDGQIRHRYELTKRTLAEDTNPFGVNFLRTRVGIKFEKDSLYGAFVQIQDSRVFGEEFSTILDGSADNMDFHQAYLFVDKFIISSMNLKLGRFEAAYGTERLIGAFEWNNIGRSFDGGIITYKTENLDMDFFNFKTDEQFNPGDVDDNNFLGVYGDLKLNETSSLDFFLLNDWELPGSYTLRRYTIGGAYYATFGSLKVIGEVAYQTGNIDVGTGRSDVSAVMITANAEFELKSFTAFGGLDYLSGDEDNTDGDYGVFNTLYATNHKFYGYMDYFLNIPLNTYGKGLTDIHAGARGKFNEKFSYLGKFHVFLSSKEYENLTGDKSSVFGYEIDTVVKYKYNKDLNFHLGISYLFAGQIFKWERGPDDGYWMFLMTTLNL